MFKEDYMPKLKQPVEPFGDINVIVHEDCLEIVVSILVVPDVENAQVGLALDASASLKKMYGASGLVGSAFFQSVAIPNLMEPVSKSIATFLTNFSGDGKVHLIYWACDPIGNAIEEIGYLSEQELANVSIQGPKKHQWGRGTKLLPPLKYFLDDKMRNSPWSLIIFVTDGILEDLAEIKQYCLQVGQDIAAKRRNSIKLVLLGIGEEVDESQMEELDDMFEGTGLQDPNGNNIDLWCHKLASDMKRMEDVFAEVVSENTIIIPQGKILDDKGNVVRSYSDGLPAKFRFMLPKSSHSFTLEYPGGSVSQDISEVFE
jgi:hypothetical protein